MSSRLRIKSASFGNAGWVLIRLSGRAVPVVFVRLSDRANRLVISELYLEGDLSDYRLDSIPIRRLEDWLNLPDQALATRNRISLPGPDLRTAASHYATTVHGPIDLTPDGRGIDWAKEMLISQMGVPGVPTASRGRMESIQRSLLAESTVLTIPTSTPYPESFWKELAVVYEDLVIDGQPPNATIAKANGVPKTTVDRWIRRARELGFLAESRGKGRAG
jgi:hypothetical protein